MDLPDLLRRAYDEEAAYLTTLESLVAFESPTHHPTLAGRLADALQARLERDGWELERLPREEVGPILRAKVAGAADADDGAGTLLLAHYDTVWPPDTLATMPFDRDGDVVRGPGVLDMKAGIATALHAVALAREAAGPAAPVTLLLTSDEEVGSGASRAVIEAEARRHARVLVLEPGRDDGALKVGRKGTAGFELRLQGVSAHAGNDPENGASALRELAHLLFYAEGLADAEAGTTVNVTVASGGGASNVIAEGARATVDVRVLRAGEVERVAAGLRAYAPRDARVAVEVSGGENRPPLEATDANGSLLAEAREALAGLGLEVGEAVVGGGSDGNFTSALGVPTLDGLGSVGSGPHARHERIRVRETLERLALVTALLLRAR